MGGIVKLVPLNSDFDTFFASFFRPRIGGTYPGPRPKVENLDHY